MEEQNHFGVKSLGLVEDAKSLPIIGAVKTNNSKVPILVKAFIKLQEHPKVTVLILNSKCCNSTPNK